MRYEAFVSVGDLETTVILGGHYLKTLNRQAAKCRHRSARQDRASFGKTSHTLT